MSEKSTLKIATTRMGLIEELCTVRNKYTEGGLSGRSRWENLKGNRLKNNIPFVLMADLSDIHSLYYDELTSRNIVHLSEVLV
jgi:hypothetical protein